MTKKIRPITYGLLFIILCYVLILNAIIISMLYKKYGHMFQWVTHSRARSKFELVVDTVHNTTNLNIHKPILKNTVELSCDRSLQLVVIVTQSRNMLSNDISKQVSLLTRLRTMLHDKRYVNINMLLSVDVNTFMPVHRSLCSNIPRCTLLLTMNNDISDIFAQVSRIKPCIHDIILLTDKANIDATFFSRVALTDDSRITCLLESPEGQICPDIAYRIPRSFFETYTGTTVDIMSAATIQGVAAPAYPLFTNV